MPTLTVGDRKVTVGDGFLKLSPEQQNATVEEIAASLGVGKAREQQPSALMDAVPETDAAGNLTGAMTQVSRAAMPYGEQMSKVGGALDKGARLVANGMTFGLADKFAGGMDALTGKAKTYDEGVKAQRAETQAIRDANPAVAGAAEMAGGMAGGVGLIKNGATLAGRFGPRLLPRVFGYGAEGATYGAAHGAGNTYSDKAADYIENAKGGATAGALIGGGLPIAGAAAGGAYRAGSAFLGPQIEGVGRGASSMLRVAAQADEAGLRRLSQMGPDAMLVDAGPSMLGLGQGAGTGTGPGRTALVNNLRARDAETGPRLARALDENLGTAPLPSRVEAGLSGDRAYVGQEYAPLMENARAVNTQPLAQHLETASVNLRGPAQQAVQRVRGMLDIPGNPGTLDPHPQALLSTRHAIDGLMAVEANPTVIRELTLARQAVDAELARAVPGIKAVDAQIAESSRQSAGLQRGTQVFDTGKTAIRPADLTQEISNAALPEGTMVGPSATPLRIRQGARAEVDRIVGTQVNDLNALERTIATPHDWNSQKFAGVFGEGPRAQVAEALMNNRRFRESYQNIVQNSQTAQRVESAAAMKGGEGGNVPHDVTVTGLGLKALNAVAKVISGASNANTKDEIGRVLSSQGPAVQRVAQALLDSAQSASANSRALSRILSAPQLIGAGGPEYGRK